MTKKQSIIPKRGKGRPSKGSDEAYQAGILRLVKFMKEIQSTLDFKMSSRGWCYALEPYGLLKGDFDYGQRIINDCRKSGLLPMGFMLDEEGRSFDTWEPFIDFDDPDEYAEWKIQDLFDCDNYTPFSFWDMQECYIQMLVEKIDLKSLFSEICKTYQIPIATAKGWSSIGQREALIQRYTQHPDKMHILLYCGDHDPAGLRISETIRKNLNDLYPLTGWSADDLIIDRFGLNYEFIKQNNLTWIENLETGSGAYPLSDPRHPDHRQAYVQNYISAYGVRKCEANALVVAPEIGRKLCLETVNKYIPASALDDYSDELLKIRLVTQQHIVRLVENGAIKDLLS